MIFGIWIALAVLMTVGSSDAMRVMQRGGYRFREYRMRLALSEYLPAVAATAVGVLGAFLFELIPGEGSIGWSGVALGYVVLLSIQLLSKHVPPLKATDRCKRLYVTLAVLNLVFAGALAAVCYAAHTAAWAGFAPVAELLAVPIAAAMMQPFERKKQRVFVERAKRRLAEVHPTVIGVTGSYGKTGVKNLIRDLLSVRFRVCASPLSYNTPMGLCRTITENLAPTDEYLIAEMGARYSGDIRELTEIAPPDIAVVTGIGSQHLETFGSREALANAKYEIVEGLKAGGLAVFAGDEGSLKLYERGYRPAIALGRTDGPFAVSLRNLRIGPDGSEFDLTVGSRTVRARTALIGAHNLENLRLAATVAAALGLDAEEIARGVAKTKPVPHRLQLLPKTGTFRVIDDSYNASVEGIRAAADVLSLFSPSRAVITPGIIEAGKETDMANFRAGCLFGGACETAYVYGPNVRQLVKGLTAGGLREERIHRVRSRDEAVKRLQSERDVRVVLFSNDLPN